jgi:hypothetical protein
VVAGLTATGSLASADPRVPDPHPSSSTSAMESSAMDTKVGDEEREPGARNLGTPVPCDTNALVAAILLADRDGGSLDLARDCTYVLTANQDGSGLPTITERVTITGDHTTITRAANATDFRVFTVGSGGELKLSGLTITGGKDSSGVGGGAILVEAGGFATITRSTLRGNQTSTDGGAILSRGILAVSHSTLTGNVANGGVSKGGAIASLAGQVTVDDSHLDRNAAPPSGGTFPTRPAGGALYSKGSVVVIRDSTANDNESEVGGALSLAGPTTISDITISDNRASFGGGMNLDATATVVVRHGRISGNSVDKLGGGIYTDGNLLLEDSRVTANTTTFATGGIQKTGTLTLRRTSVDHNTAFGNRAAPGGIAHNSGVTTLIDSRITDNVASDAPGGVSFSTGEFNLRGSSVIIGNSPTNCRAINTQPVPGCFG